MASFINWSDESLLGAQWNILPADGSVTQSFNGGPSVFYGDIKSTDVEITGSLTLPPVDDDFIGFVLGYQSGSISGDSGSEFLLIDWRSQDQYHAAR